MILCALHLCVCTSDTLHLTYAYTWNVESKKEEVQLECFLLRQAIASTVCVTAYTWQHKDKKS